MKVEIVGGGPSGLYLAILLKRADRTVDVRVRERNAPDATFGWGVVFSEETLGSLRDADPETHLAITDTFARWDRVEIRYRDRVLSSYGHSFSAIARRRLLEILQRRCAALDIEVEFGVEVGDLPADADLVVGADGANSFVRRLGEFGTAVEPEGCKYVWFGTDLVFDAFTFAFRETEHGLFNVHAYPFDERTSTFIVECPEETWRRAGLDAMDEDESLAFCEQLFANDLRGRELFSNRSLWLDFPKVSNRVWHDGRVVLIGDAAHTAHFSIGSGTKLAMEDAIALANALVRRRWEVEPALVDFELERQPVVERTQAAASESAAHFGRIASYSSLEPVQFAFNLLTRSGRITHASLTVRDPAFTRVLDAWHAGRSGGVATAPMFTPLELGALTFPNRLVAASPEHAAGPGLLLSGFVAVSAEARTTPACPTVEDAGWRASVEAAHDAGALFGLQLGHAGRRGATRPASVGIDVPLLDGRPLVSASPLRYGPYGAVPVELDEPGMAEVVARFAAGATSAAAARADLLELDFAHGYLLAGFLSPLSNRRTDDYGGSLEGRLRFPLALLDAVRAAWPGVLAVRLSVTDWSPRGNGVDEGISVARALVSHGCELIHVEAGQTIAEDRPEHRRGFLTGLSDRVRNEAGIPTLVRGHLTTPDDANTIVGAGRADLCILDLPPTPLERELDPAQAEAGNSLLLTDARRT